MATRGSPSVFLNVPESKEKKTENTQNINLVEWSPGQVLMGEGIITCFSKKNILLNDSAIFAICYKFLF